MTDQAPRQLFTTAAIEMLRRTRALGGTGMTVHDHRTPANRAFPYCVVRSVPGGVPDGPGLGGAQSDARIVLQVDSVGTRRDQAQWAGDIVRSVMIGRDAGGAFAAALPDVPGWAVCDRLLTSAEGGVEVQGSQSNEVFVVQEQYELRVTPSPPP